MENFVTAENVFIDCDVRTRDEALAFIAQAALDLGVSNDKQAVLDAFLAREAEGTTGMMGGFAIPHAKSAAISDAKVVVVKFSDTVEWESMDGEPIRVAIALLVPEAEMGTTHLKLLSTVAVMLMDDEFKARVLESNDAAQIAAEISGRL